MVFWPAFSLLQLMCLHNLVNALAFPILNATSASSDPNLNGSIAKFVNDEGHYYPIPNTLLTLHLTIFSTKVALPFENTLICLHNLAKALALEPQSDYLDRMRIQTTSNMEAIISPVKCPGCGLTYRESTKVLAGLWYYTSRQELLYVQRYGVFEGRTMRMVAWGRLQTRPPAPEMREGMEMVSTLPSGVRETS